MLTFADLHIALRGGYLTLIFILLCVSGLGVIATTVLGKKRFVK